MKSSVIPVKSEPPHSEECESVRKDFKVTKNMLKIVKLCVPLGFKRRLSADCGGLAETEI